MIKPIQLNGNAYDIYDALLDEITKKTMTNQNKYVKPNEIRTNVRYDVLLEKTSSNGSDKKINNLNSEMGITYCLEFLTLKRPFVIEFKMENESNQYYKKVEIKPLSFDVVELTINNITRENDKDIDYDPDEFDIFSEKRRLYNSILSIKRNNKK